MTVRRSDQISRLGPSWIHSPVVSLRRPWGFRIAFTWWESAFCRVSTSRACKYLAASGLTGDLFCRLLVSNCASDLTASIEQVLDLCWSGSKVKQATFVRMVGWWCSLAMEEAEVLVTFLAAMAICGTAARLRIEPDRKSQKKLWQEWGMSTHPTMHASVTYADRRDFLKQDTILLLDQ